MERLEPGQTTEESNKPKEKVKNVLKKKAFGTKKKKTELWSYLPIPKYCHSPFSVKLMCIISVSTGNSNGKFSDQNLSCGFVLSDIYKVPF